MTRVSANIPGAVSKRIRPISEIGGEYAALREALNRSSERAPVTLAQAGPPRSRRPRAP